MDIISFLNEHQQYAGPVVMIVMVLESAPLTGFFIPGTVILPLLGAMSASSGIDFWTLFAFAVSGAFIGDLSGYWLGRLSAHKWLPALLKKHRQRNNERAHELLKKHGLAAIFFGRFVWLIHPAIPGAAGLLGVKPLHFIALDSLATILWVLFYLGGGHLLTGFWNSRTFELVESIGLILVVFSLLYILRSAIYYLIRR